MYNKQNFRKGFTASTEVYFLSYHTKSLCSWRVIIILTFLTIIQILQNYISIADLTNYFLMDTGVQNLLEASVKLECTIETTARALILYHHFMRCVDEVQYDQSMVAAVALNLSGRINEQILEVDSLICVFYSIVNKTTEVLSPDDITFLMLRKSLVSIDFLMQRMLEFNLNHRIAHQYLVPFLTLIFERSRNIAEYRSELSNTCIRLLSDFYTSRNCLNYKPEHIAIACIDLSLYIHGLINDLVMVPVWYKGFCNDVNVGRIKQIKRDMMAFYRKGISH